MNLKPFFLIVFLYILALFQTSFFVHFSVFNILPNFILISVILINLLEKSQESSGWWAAGSGGFFWDIFSVPLEMVFLTGFIGFYTLILLLGAFFIKKIFKKYIG